MAKPVSVQHLAGRPIGGIQRCERCGMVLIDHSAAPKPLFGTFRFWQTGASVYAKPPECGPCSRRKHFSAVSL